MLLIDQVEIKHRNQRANESLQEIETDELDYKLCDYKTLNRLVTTLEFETARKSLKRHRMESWKVETWKTTKSSVTSVYI